MARRGTRRSLDPATVDRWLDILMEMLHIANVDTSHPAETILTIMLNLQSLEYYSFGRAGAQGDADPGRPSAPSPFGIPRH